MIPCFSQFSPSDVCTCLGLESEKKSSSWPWCPICTVSGVILPRWGTKTSTCSHVLCKNEYGHGELGQDRTLNAFQWVRWKICLGNDGKNSHLFLSWLRATQIILAFAVASDAYQHLLKMMFSFSLRLMHARNICPQVVLLRFDVQISFFLSSNDPCQPAFHSFIEAQ